MLIFELLLFLLALSLVLALIAKRFDVPLAVALVLGGMALAFVPGLPEIELEPELALALFLPPLLQMSAYRTDWPTFRRNLRPILLLAFGAVIFTAIAVALVAKWLVPSLPWGATMAGSFSWGQGLGSFVLSGLGGVAIGWAIGRGAIWVFRRLEDTRHDIAVSVLAGFVAYLLAEAAHVSGVLGVVACGLILGRGQHHEFTARTRLESAAVWDFIEFVLTAFIFMLIGLQLRGIIERLEEYDAGRLALLAGVVAATLIVSRFLWVFPAAAVPRLLSRDLRERDPLPPRAELTVISWAGMRGVVSLAAALALPMRFPGRDIIVFLAFSAIFATLILQGTTLGPLIRRLGIAEPDVAGVDPAQASLRREANDAALAEVQAQVAAHGAVAEELVQEFRGRAEQAAQVDEHGDSAADRRAQQQRLRLDALEAARAKLAVGVEEETSRALIVELDLEEEQIRRELGER